MYYSLKHKLPHLVESTILKQEILPRLLSLTSTLRHKFDNPEKGVRSQNSEASRGSQIYAEVY